MEGLAEAQQQLNCDRDVELTNLRARVEQLREELTRAYKNGDAMVLEARERLAQVELALSNMTAERDNLHFRADMLVRQVAKAERERDEIGARENEEHNLRVETERERNDLRARVGQLQEQIEFMRDGWSEIGARACPACLYEGGKFIRACKLHERLAKVERERDEKQALLDAFVSMNYEEILGQRDVLSDALEHCKVAREGLRARVAALEADLKEARRDREALWNAAPMNVSRMADIKLRWASGPEQYQADADELIAGILAAMARISKLEEALTKLKNEARGILSLGIQDITGYTNQACLQLRVDEAEALLAKDRQPANREGLEYERLSTGDWAIKDPANRESKE